MVEGEVLAEQFVLWKAEGELRGLAREGDWDPELPLGYDGVLMGRGIGIGIGIALHARRKRKKIAWCYCARRSRNSFF